MSARRVMEEIGKTFLGLLLVLFLVLAGCGALGIYIALHDKRETQEQAWERMCAGPERYDAMREADAKGKPNPC